MPSGVMVTGCKSPRRSIDLMRGARSLSASERCRTPTLMESTRRSSSICPCASDMGDPLMAGCGSLEDVGETRHAAAFARQVAERQQLQIGRATWRDRGCQYV